MAPPRARPDVAAHVELAGRHAEDLRRPAEGLGERDRGGRRILLEPRVEDRQLLLRLQLLDLRRSAAAAIISKILPM